MPGDFIPGPNLGGWHRRLACPGRRLAEYLFSSKLAALRSAGFQTCCVAGFQAGITAQPPAGLETRDTADLEVCATLNRYRRLADRNRDSRTLQVAGGICQESHSSIRRASGPAGRASRPCHPESLARRRICLVNTPLKPHIVVAGNGTTVMSTSNKSDHLNRLTGRPSVLDLRHSKHLKRKTSREGRRE
jgi:hypothetical protein